MLLKHGQFEISAASGLLMAADAAARAVPPAFPLTATVAVNPFLGQSGQDLATASARLARVAGVRLTPPRRHFAAELAAGRVSDEDLAAALSACSSALKPATLDDLKSRLAGQPDAPEPLPTVAQMASNATGVDWPAVFARSFGLWAVGHFDRGQALWLPAPGQRAWRAWRDWAVHDLTPEIAGLAGFCARVANAADTPERAIAEACGRLGIGVAEAPTAFHRLLADLGGWAQHARWMLWQAEMQDGADATLLDLLAIRLLWEDALLALCPQVRDEWAAIAAGHARPVEPSPDDVLDAILQEASERASQRRMPPLGKGSPMPAARPAIQAAFCIDVRSEPFRRIVETLDPQLATIGFAGFFGLGVSHCTHGTDEAAAHLPVLLNPSLAACSHASADVERAARVTARAWRAWGRFRQAAVSSFAFVEAAGPGYAWKLLRDSLSLNKAAGRPDPAPRLRSPLSPEEKAAIAAAVLRAMSMTTGHARLVLLLGHGATATNNAHESAYHCGACGGQTGEVSARLLAQLLNDPETRSGLPAHGVEVPADTLFVAGLHNTTTDEVILHSQDAGSEHAADIARARQVLDRATGLARAKRAARLPGATAESVAARAADWAQVRPEWGLAGCSVFIAAPREATAGVDLQGRAFLHSYDWRADRDFSTLELILTAPVVVASWISLQYYGSSVAPEAFGGGNKLLHNVVGGIGVVEGNGGMLRAGLPWQTVHDGEKLAHQPLRLTVLVEAPREAIENVLSRHRGVRELFDNGWLHLFALDEGSIAARYRPGLRWEAASRTAAAA